MNSLSAVGSAAQIGTSIFNIFQGAKMLKDAKKINPDYYGIDDSRLNGMESQYAKNMLGRAQTQVNARMMGASVRERQIQGARAGTQAAIARGAVDPTMAMQAMLASQAQGDEQITNQFMMDNQFQQQKEANLMNAQGTMISERDKALQEKGMKYQMDMSQKNALRNAGQQSISSAGSALAGIFMGLGAQKDANSRSSMNYLSKLMG